MGGFLLIPFDNIVINKICWEDSKKLTYNAPISNKVFFSFSYPCFTHYLNYYNEIKIYKTKCRNDM